MTYKYVPDAQPTKLKINNTKKPRHIKVSEENAASASKLNGKLKFCKAMY
jgi:uncharacterized protein YhbP (UPF0306 family)